MPDIRPTSDAAAVAAAIDHLRAGRAVVFPTDTVYGLGALPSVAGATDALFALKGRTASTPLAVLVGSAEQAATLIEPPSVAAQRLMDHLWPGPLTLVLTRRHGIDLALGGDPATIGVRCPDHELVLALTAAVGPLAVTSANRHGEPTPVAAADVAAALGEGVALVLDGGPCAGTASTVIDVTHEHLNVLRVGPISEKAALAVALP